MSAYHTFGIATTVPVSDTQSRASRSVSPSVARNRGPPPTAPRSMATMPPPPYMPTHPSKKGALPTHITHLLEDETIVALPIAEIIIGETAKALKTILSTSYRMILLETVTSLNTAETLPRNVNRNLNEISGGNATASNNVGAMKRWRGPGRELRAGTT